MFSTKKRVPVESAAQGTYTTDMLFLAAEAFDEKLMQKLIGETVYLILTLSAPMLLAAIATGLAISIFQATTQIQEQTLSFVPKIVATFAAVIIFGIHTARECSAFTQKVILLIFHFGPPPPAPPI